MLPDLHTSKGLLHPLAQSGDPPMIRLAREDEGIGIASALSYCDKRALLMMQYTGLLDSVNALRAVSLDYKLPLAMMVGLLGHDPEKPPHESRATACASSRRSSTPWAWSITRFTTIATCRRSTWHRPRL